MTFPFEDDMEQTPSQTEDSVERGFVDERQDEDLGHADTDPDSAGDIADEGTGHRG